LTDFDTLGLRPPIFVKEIDAFCEKLKEKKNEFLAKRKELVERAEKGELKVDELENHNYPIKGNSKR